MLELQWRDFHCSVKVFLDKEFLLYYDLHMSQMDQLSPIVVFGFNRPGHLRRCLRSLEKNYLAGQSDLFIFIDGPRNLIDWKLVLETQIVASEPFAFKSISLHCRNENFGLANSIVMGIDELMETNEKLIVVEDDLTFGRNFLTFMNVGLSKYSNKKNVSSIQGYSYPFRKENDESFFIRGADCWGWGTWKDRWGDFEKDASKLLVKIYELGLEEKFDLSGAYQYTEMLKKQSAGKIDSWAVRWHAQNFIEGKLALYPPQSLVKNMGQDGSGTNFGKSKIYKVRLKSLKKFTLPDIIIETELNVLNLAKFHKSTKGRKLSRGILKLLKVYK